MAEEEVEGWDSSDSFKPLLDDESSSSSSSDEEEEDDENILPTPRGMEWNTVKYKKIVHEEELLPE
jgi:hypothetical protein